MPETFIHFEHGLGDAANFARTIPLYLRRGHAIRISTTPDKRWLFRAVGAEVEEGPRRGTVHPWHYPDVDTVWSPLESWQGNKNGCNLSRAPLPDIGPRNDLWPEYCAPCSIDAAAAISKAVREKIDAAIAGLPRPLILLHTIGNTGSQRKSLPIDQHFPLYCSLLDCGGTIILLDWDNRAPLFDHFRLRPFQQLVSSPGLEDLFALMTAADLVVGVDSGPLHLAGLTATPRVGLFRDGHYPSTYLLPRGFPPRLDLSLVGSNWRNWTREKRIPFGIAETDWGPADVARQSLAMLGAPRIGRQVAQFLELCRGHTTSGLGYFVDRHASFRLVLERARPGNWIETGTIRQAEDWPGAGFSTYLFGAFLQRLDPTGEQFRLWSVDIDSGNCAFARRQTAVFGNNVRIVESRGDDFLRAFEGQIDFLYLDSCDTTVPGYAEVCLEELLAALPKLAPGALIAIDDTPFHHGNWTGKGAHAVPHLLANGWRILFAGYQVLLERSP